MDESLITQELQKDPWVASATYERQFPNTLRITITERKVTAIVALSSGPVAWYLGENNVWLEQISSTYQKEKLPLLLRLRRQPQKVSCLSQMFLQQFLL